MKPHDTPSLPGALVDELFPFHCLINEHDNHIVSVGDALAPLLRSDYEHCQFGELFRIVRPNLTGLTAEIVNTHARSCVIMEVIDTDIVLRGQFVQPDDRHILFVGSVLAQNADYLENLGIGLNSFAPFDLTPEVVILRMFREIETKDIHKRTKMLADLSKSRDVLSEHAYTDALTKITNRRGFWNKGTKILNDHKNNNESTIVLALLDLDGFKEINDKHGHDAGDSILCEAAERIRDTVGNHGIAGRLGGDEFVLMLILEQQHDVKEHVEQTLREINNPFQQQFQQLAIKASIGVTEIEAGDTLEHAIHHADLAMYEGRKDKRGLISWYTAGLAQRIEDKKQMQGRLLEAIKNGLIEPHFQPIISFDNFELSSFEALARWNDSELGMVRPDIFIAQAEEIGMLDQLDHLIMEKSLDQLACWHNEGKMYSLHINVSAASLKSGLVDRVVKALNDRKIDSDYLKLELTETTILDTTDFTIDVLHKLRDNGLTLTLDDFGTGYSSLTHIKDFPVSGLKIDRSFVADAHIDEKSKALLCAVATIAIQMDLYIIAEGIESEEQLDFLRNIGCHYGQGFYIGKPAAANTCEQLFPEQKDAAA